jgi:ketosteroid isomerase-like protein
MFIKRIITAIASTLLLFSCGQPQVDHEAEGEALMQLSRDWSALAATGDIDSIIDFWADDAVMMAPDLPPLEGKQAIRSYLETAMATPGFSISWEPLSAHVSQSGDLAYLIERNVVELDDADGGHIVIHGKAVTIWRKNENGNWENVVDMWNSAPPPAQ